MSAPRSPEMPGARRLLHFVLVVLGWVGFGWMWLLVSRQPADFARLIWLIAGSCVVLPLVTLFWVQHNRAIHRRKGERRGVAQAEAAYSEDWHGRKVDADWRTLRFSQIVTITVADGRKLYRSGASQAPASQRRDEFVWRPSRGTPLDSLVTTEQR